MPKIYAIIVTPFTSPQIDIQHAVFPQDFPKISSFFGKILSKFTSAKISLSVLHRTFHQLEFDLYNVYGKNIPLVGSDLEKFRKFWENVENFGRI